MLFLIFFQHQLPSLAPDWMIISFFTTAFMFALVLPSLFSLRFFSCRDLFLHPSAPYTPLVDINGTSVLNGASIISGLLFQPFLSVSIRDSFTLSRPPPYPPGVVPSFFFFGQPKTALPPISWALIIFFAIRLYFFFTRPFVCILVFIGRRLFVYRYDLLALHFPPLFLNLFLMKLLSPPDLYALLSRPLPPTQSSAHFVVICTLRFLLFY